MKNTLKNIYQHNLIDNVSEFDFKDYYYFVENNNNIFGISKNNITDHELSLILTQYELFKEDDLNENSQVLDFLFENKAIELPYSHLKYYLIKCFNVSDLDIYEELFHLLKDTTSPEMFLIKRQNIFIIITVDDHSEIEFKNILQSIETDFLIKIIGFESDVFEVNSDLPLYFQMDYDNFNSFKSTNHLIINKVNLLNQYLIHHVEQDIKKMIKSYILKDYINDQEMMNVVKMYFECNFNTTLAAKNCYMHRNTFLNKLDKFSSTTHFNLRNYDEAFMIYLAILM